MRVLCVYPQFPKSYWGAEYTRRFTGKKSFLPPLGLLTVAALLPPEWEIHLCDLNVRPLDPAELAWADVIFLSAMIIQHDSLLEVVQAARRAGKIIVAGGPYATLNSEPLQPLVDCLVVGEAENLIQPLVAALQQKETLPARFEAHERPDIKLSPIPRFDLINAKEYQSLCLQSSRGCPFNCEFCDIIEIFGRKPRFKTPHQLLSELDAIRATGFHGSVFIVDDNFIGNKAKVHKLLESMAIWMSDHAYPFDFYTQSSINLAADDMLIDAMVKAGFSAVFLGIETASEKALRQAQKIQNTSVEIDSAVEKLLSRGLDVMAGFIIGFDTDDESTIEQQRRWIAQSSIPLAMVGILKALPGTQLERRLIQEGRMLFECGGDNFSRPNFITKIDETTLLHEYACLLEEIYQPRSYFKRALRTLKRTTKGQSHFKLSPAFALACLLRSLFYQGILADYRGEYWKYLWHALRQSPKLMPYAIRFAIQGEHLIRYTREDVLPRLLNDIAMLQQTEEQQKIDTSTTNALAS